MTPSERWARREYDFNVRLIAVILGFWLDRRALPKVEIIEGVRLFDGREYPVFAVRSDMVDGLPPALRRAP